VTLSFAGETLTVTGVASHQWIDESRKLARVIPGVSDFKTEGVVDADAPLARELAASKGRLEKFIVYFIVDTAELASGQDDTVMNLTTEVQRFFRLAQQAGKEFLLEIVGHTDTNGSPRRNSQLRQERAESVRVMLLSHGVPKEAMTAIAVEERVREEVAEQDKELNRCVTFRVIPLEAVRTAP
jgi:OOP family OmpA-OmpF porin